MSLLGNLLPASFRGVPFAVIDQATSTGRRIALHQYPGRDAPWAEDMGRDARRWRFRGFIVDNDPVYDGGPIELQRLALLAAAEGQGSGILTHPTLGLLSASCETLSITEGLDGASFSSIEFSFIESGQQGLPSLFVSGFGVSSAVVAAVSVVADALRVIALSNQASSGSASGALPATTTAWSAQVVALGNDATALQRLTAALPGNLGRYSRGATSGFLASLTATNDTVPELVALAAGQRAAIAAAAASLQQTVSGLTVTSTELDYVDAADALVQSLATACADPADALRLLALLLAYAPLGVSSSSAAGVAVGLLFQRLTSLAIVRAVLAYQPSSYEDAFAKLVWVTRVLDAAILAAGDAGQDDLYAALRALRVQVVADLRARGALLAHVRTYTFAAPIPAIVMAQRLYRDVSRADELIGEAGDACVSPLFMPTSLQGLTV